jgi:hypothetical protein
MTLILLGDLESDLGDEIREMFLNDTDIQPILEATVRQTRLSFEDDDGKPWPINYNITIDETEYGEESFGKKIWGDVSAQKRHIARAFSLAAVIKEYSPVWYMGHYGKITSLGDFSTSWEYNLLPDPGTGPLVCMASCRIGLSPHDGCNDRHYVWYINEHRMLCRDVIKWDEDEGRWEWYVWYNHADELMPIADTYAVLPVDNNKEKCVVLSAVDGWIQYTYCTCDENKVWNVRTTRTLWHGEDVKTWWIYFSDLTSGDGELILTLNLADHGAAHAFLLNTSSNIMSHPMPILGGGIDDSGYRNLPCGLSKYNDRRWLVSSRAIEGSEGFPYAPHMAIASTDPTHDGRHWMDGDFIGEHTCFGKLVYSELMADEEDPQYCYVVGNATVYRAPVTTKLGYDNPLLKHVVEEATSWELQVPPAGGASTVQSNWMNSANVISDLADAGLLVPDNELEIRITVAGQDQNDPDAWLPLFKGYLSNWQRTYGYSGLDTYGDQFSNRGIGPIYRLTGEGAYHPPGGRTYDGPTPWYSNFTTKDGNYGRSSISSRYGAWAPLGGEGKISQFVIQGMPDPDRMAGIALIPRRWTAREFIMYCRIKFKQSVQGGYFVFFYKGSEDYWLAGVVPVYNESTEEWDVKLVVYQKNGGKWHLKASTSTLSLSIDAWYKLYMRVSLEEIECFIHEAPYDYDMKLNSSDLIGSIAYKYLAISGEEPSLPTTYHVGLGCRDRLDFTDADTHGYVSEAYEREIQDITKSFGHDVVGMWVAVKYDFQHTHWGKIIDFREELYEREDGTKHYIALSLDTVFPEIPTIGCSYGIYDEPIVAHILVDDLGFCDGKLPWTVGDIAQDVLVTSSVERAPYDDTRLSSDLATRELDLRSQYSDSKEVELQFHTAHTEGATSGMVIDYDPDNALFPDAPRLGYTVKAEPHSTWYITHYMPSMYKYPLNTRKWSDWRILVFEDTVLVYIDGRLANCYWDIGSSGSGYIIQSDDRTWERHSFGAFQGALSWTRDEPANTVLARLLRGRRAKLVETPDGKIELSTFESKQSIGQWKTPVVQRGIMEAPRPGIIGMVGAEVQAFYLEPELSRRSLRFRQSENPTVVTEAETLAEAHLVSKLAEEQASGENAVLQIIDPGVCLERTVYFSESDLYIVDAYSFAYAMTSEGIESSMSAKLRLVPEDKPKGRWGVGDHWGKVYWG